jgi:hypothetical protein
VTSHHTGVNEQVLYAMSRTYADRDWPNFRALSREARENLILLCRLRGLLDDGTTVNVDARRQVALLGNLSTDDLRSLAQAAEQGRLEEAAERVGLPLGDLAPRLQPVSTEPLTT